MTTPTPRPMHAADRSTRAFLSQDSARQVVGYLLASVGTVAIVAILLPIRDDLTPLSAGFAFLGLVVLTVAIGGLGPGIAASVLGFLAFNFFFIPPFGTFRIGRGQDVVVLFACAWPVGPHLRVVGARTRLGPRSRSHVNASCSCSRTSPVHWWSPARRRRATTSSSAWW